MSETNSPSAATVKELREKTGAGMMDCKRALIENNCDFEAAIDWLRQKGLSSAAKKSGRVAAEGLVAVATNGTSGIVVEVNSESDFVARNENFQKLVKTLAGVAIASKLDLDGFLKTAYPNTGKTISEEMTEAVATIGENVVLRRLGRVDVTQGVVTSYVHTQLVEGLGKIGVLVGLESAAPADKLNDLARKIAMHIAAAKPESVSVDNLDAALVERERQILIAQARDSGKAEEFIGKMVEGRIRKFYEEVVLLEQSFVMNPDKRVKDILADAGTEFGTPVTLTSFVRFALGEGIQKEESNFADEVAAMTATNVA